MFGSEDCSDAESVCMAMVAGSWDTTESELVVFGQLGLQWLVVVILQILWRGSRVLLGSFGAAVVGSWDAAVETMERQRGAAGCESSTSCILWIWCAFPRVGLCI